jgi:hypothetical protein
MTTRAFTVVVTGCSDCPFADNGDQLDCLHDYKTAALASNRWIQNVQRITPSCPMWNEAKPFEELK